jgi:hypothetical protein
MNSWQDVWTRLRNGQHVVLSNAGPIPQPEPDQLRLVWVDCEAFPQPRGTLREACRRMDQLVETPHPVLEAAAERLRAGVRRHLLGEAREGVEAASHLEVFQRAVPAGQPRAALLLDGIDRADSASLELLTRWIHDGRAFEWPLLLSFEEREPVGQARRLLKELESRLPPEAFWSDRAPGDEQAARALPNLSPTVLRVLRAGATVGDRFESEVLAKLLRLDELDVLGALQEAADQGAPLTDRGEGIFRLETGWAGRLRQGILPSLARAWHERLAQLFGGLPAPAPSAAPADCTDSGSAGSPRVLAPEASSPRPVTEAVPVAPSAAAAVPAPPVERATAPDPKAWFEGKESVVAGVDSRSETWWQRLSADLSAARPTAAGAPELGPASPEPPVSTRGGNEQRSAAHAEAAGLWEVACEQHLAAAERASLDAEHPLALELASRALSLSERLAGREQRRQLQMRALLVVGRARWQHQGSGRDSTLQAALDSLLRCRALVLESDSPQLRAELGSLIANVQYDIGTPEALELALLELTRASQLLLDAGQPLDAARLLNDEAAVWVKIGDPVRANHLLSHSRDVFSKVADSYPAARVELLETEHLLARLMLHARPRPGRERDALAFGIEHGRSAEEGYRELNSRRQLARVWETLGRLELRLDHVDEAGRLLEDARQLQLKLGDLVGLARSSGALCELLVRTGDYPRALERLAESIAFNAKKGSYAGLEFNLASLTAIQPELPPGMHDAARALEARLQRELS